MGLFSSAYGSGLQLTSSLASGGRVTGVFMTARLSVVGYGSECGLLSR